MRVDSSLEGYYRFLSLDGLSDFLGDLDERVALTHITMSVTVILKYYVSSHRKDPRL